MTTAERETATSPLAEIEQRVAEKAKDLAIDLDRAGAETALRRLVDEEIDRWADDHARGRRPHALADPQVVAERALRNIVGLGPLGPLLEDDDVWEIMVNAPDAVFVSAIESLGTRRGLPHAITSGRSSPGSSPARPAPPASSTPPRAQDAHSTTGCLHIVHATQPRGQIWSTIRSYRGPFFRSRRAVER